MAHTRDPLFRDMNATDVQELLARNHVGRIAYSFHDRVDIEPISYVFADGAFYMRTEPGSKLATLAHAPWVALEVDEVDGLFDWRSVVAHGTVYVLHDEGTPDARARYGTAVERIRELMPEALDTADPAPARRVIIKLYPETLVGREACSATLHAGAAPRARSRMPGGFDHAPISARSRVAPSRPRAC